MAEYKFDQLIKQLDTIAAKRNTIADSMEELHKTIKKFEGKTGIDQFTTALNKVSAAIKSLTDTQKDQLKTEKELEKERKKAIAQREKLNQSLNVETQANKELIKLRQRDVRERAKQIATEKQYGKVQKDSIIYLRQQQKELTQLRNRLSTTGKQYKDVTEKLKGVNLALQKTQDQSKEGRPGIVSYNNAFKQGVTQLKSYAVGLLGITAAIGAIRKIINVSKEYIELAKQQILEETKLATVLKQRTNASDEQVQSIIKLTQAQQALGVVGDEVQLAGAQQFATFVNSTESVKTLIPALNNLLVQQKGLNATQSDAVNIANLAGKAFQGQTGALSRVGITFDEAQAKILKYGTESEKAAALAEIITQNVGEMNKALAATDLGKIQQLNNEIGDIKEEIGKELIPVMRVFKSVSLSTFKEILDLTKDLTEPIRLLKEIGDNFKRSGDEAEGSKEKFEKASKGLRTLISPIRSMIKWNAILLQGLRKVLQFLNIIDSEQAKRLGNITTKVAELQKEFNNLDKVVKDKVIKDFNKLTAEFRKHNISATEYANGINEIIIKARELESPLDDIDPKINKLKTSFDRLAEAMQKGAISAKQLKEELKSIAEEAAPGKGSDKSPISAEFGQRNFKIGTDAGRSLINGMISGMENTKSKLQNYLDQLFKGEGSFLSRVFGGGEDSEAQAQQIITFYQQTISLISESINQELANIDALLDKQNEAIDTTQKLLDAETERINQAKRDGQAYDISQQQLLQAKLKREQDARNKTLAEEKKAKEKQKKLQIVQAIIDTASAVIKAFASAGNPILGAIFAAIAAAFGAIQIAKIKSQKYAEGTDFVQLKGAKKGRDTVPAMLDEGEMVVQKNLVKQLPPGFTRFMIPDAAKMYMNQNGSVYVDSRETNSHLSKIEANTRKNEVYTANGTLKYKKEGNVQWFYN